MLVYKLLVGIRRKHWGMAVDNSVCIAEPWGFVICVSPASSRIDNPLFLTPPAVGLLLLDGRLLLGFFAYSL